MRRAEKEISARDRLEAVIRDARVCHLAMVDGDRPYVVPLSFGYADNTLFFHSARAGRKIEILRRNPNVCFEFDIDCAAIPAARVCAWGMSYRSVVGFGRAVFLDSAADKQAALEVISRHYAAPGADVAMRTEDVERTLVFRVDIEQVSGKASG
jgi:uncharacterized protein